MMKRLAQLEEVMLQVGQARNVELIFQNDFANEMKQADLEMEL